LEWDRWLSSYLRPVFKNRDKPWLSLPAEERQRLCRIYARQRNAGIVRIGSWRDAIGYFKEHKVDGGLPLKFESCDRTFVLLTLNWRHSKKAILTAIGKMLDECKPEDITGIKRWDRRGHKSRDCLVMLERLAIMRLLHHYTLSEIRRLLPNAWQLYQNRKWYDDRRQALEDFRRLTGRKDSDFYPTSWPTKAQRFRSGSALPAK
jgi:hypothetical protein